MSIQKIQAMRAMSNGWGAICGAGNFGEFKLKKGSWSKKKTIHGVLFTFHAEIEGTRQQAEDYARRLGKEGYRYHVKTTGNRHQIFTNAANFV